MIITTVGIIGIVTSHIIMGVICWSLGNKFLYSNSSKALKKIELAQRELTQLRSSGKQLISGELTTETIPEIVMTSEQHFEYLKQTYPEAYNEYKEKHTRRKILDRADRYILRLILAYESGDLKASIGHCTLNFSNGDEIWIANKYYAYGQLYRSIHNNHVCFDNKYFTISPYTFLRIVDLEERLSEPVLHLSPVKVS